MVILSATIERSCQMKSFFVSINTHRLTFQLTFAFLFYLRFSCSPQLHICSHLKPFSYFMHAMWSLSDMAECVWLSFSLQWPWWMLSKVFFRRQEVFFVCGFESCGQLKIERGQHSFLVFSWIIINYHLLSFAYSFKTSNPMSSFQTLYDPIHVMEEYQSLMHKALQFLPLYGGSRRSKNWTGISNAGDPALSEMYA